jgi:aryl-alcohol dehydrogenase-like predicted oxidoreductase
MTDITATAAGTFAIGGELVVNRMGYGAMRVTGEGIWGEPDDIDAAKAVLKRVPELDVNFIDTADSYGPYVSENLLADALHPYPDDLVIATKGGLERTGPGEWPVNGKPEHLREALEGSLQRLKMDTIPLYQFHRPDPDVPFEESVGAIADMKKEGKIQHVGLSNVSVEQLEAAQEIVPIATVQNRYNLLHRTDEDVLKACEAADIGFIPWYPVGSGTLENKTVQRIAGTYEASVYQIALAWLLHHSPVMLPIPGTSSIAHLEDNVAAAAINLSDEDYQTLTAIAD